MSARLERTLAAAIAAGILPADARPPTAEDARPWPVVLLTALGAWLAAIPLLSAVVLLWGDWLSHGPGPYAIGALLLAGASVILRARGMSPFVEQLAVPALLAGLGSLGYGLGDDLPKPAALALLGGLSLALAAGLPRPWLRALLGAAAAGLLVLAAALHLVGLRDLSLWQAAGRLAVWVALYGALGVWLAGLAAQRWLERGAKEEGPRAKGPGPGKRPRQALGPWPSALSAAALESIGAGWLLAVLAGLALLSGLTLLVGAGLDPVLRDLAQAASAELSRDRLPLWAHALSALSALAATAWGGRVWPGLRRPWILGTGIAVAALAGLLPSLGGVWLVLIVTATSGRLGLAGAAAFAAAWIVGSVYYQLAWPLAVKALALGAVGATLGALVWLGAGAAARTRIASPASGPATWLIGLTAIATLTVVNVGIWQKESLIAHGQPVFLELIPVDPRSLMQGDFMRLRFRMPAGLDGASGAFARRPQAVATRDERGVTTLLRLRQPGETLAEGEFPIALTPKNGGWTVASDAWFFREGEGARWQAARYGEFRVSPDGQALLVGMADAQRRPIAAGE